MLQGALVTTNRNQSEILNGIAGVLAKLIRSIHPTRYWNGFELFDLLWSIGKGHLLESGNLNMSPMEHGFEELLKATPPSQWDIRTLFALRFS
ncbi:uncharacterized protein PADG_12443 [Paracoccidioides brasiliensis Pb18]|uniref:Uncharacterized protein n=1 Tax=Paracoccidioides brasiliensis (strain Pb18) TaxID=502780 RepID=A0A0A0HVJ8_PARBD|nr:uncharacterized protein PADG_12443 [Paracoccidioides brasiliensis Pb18]KGM91460.1 hypothetical protein PADG_12443 [Paracoccidioides brasiliensis Pb18]